MFEKSSESSSKTLFSGLESSKFSPRRFRYSFRTSVWAGLLDGERSLLADIGELSSY